MCHICGVGFNISRIRTPQEPRRAAWGSAGPIMSKSFWGTPLPLRSGFVDLYSTWSWDCDPDSGCMFTFRSIRDENKSLRSTRGKKTLVNSSVKTDDDDSDEDWVDSSENEEDEPLEYDSDEEAPGIDPDIQGVETGTTDSNEDTGENLAWKHFQRALLTGMFETNDGRWFTVERLEGNPTNNHKGSNTIKILGTNYSIRFAAKDDAADDMFPLYTTGPSSKTSDEEQDAPRQSKRQTRKKCLGFHEKDIQHVEHIAGPDCRHMGGYSGHEIGADEMRGCQTLQCLVRKPDGYIFDPLPDDEDFESSGKFFLSGLSDYMPSRDCGNPRVTLARHGCGSPPADNYMFDENDAEDVAMPFHPSCLEVYKRASMVWSKKIDINALTSWWSLEADHHLFHEFPRDPNVKRCNEQEWMHYRGTEYLVANPLHIPKLREIFASVVETDPSFSLRSGAFNLAEPPEEILAVDPFENLPAELRFRILDFLPSKAIASLRCSSRAFGQLPISYFQKLLSRECPWLWEARPTGANPSSARYAKWACFTAADMEQMTLRQQQELTMVEEYQEAVKKEVPELDQQILDEYERNIQILRDAHAVEWENIEDLEPFYLPPNKTNYFKLYTLITRHWKGLRGLQNRKRIWKDCREILKRASKYREQGRIGDDGITEKLYDVVSYNLDPARERHRREQERPVFNYDSITWVEES
jgi:hypothetical protein